MSVVRTELSSHELRPICSSSSELSMAMKPMTELTRYRLARSHFSGSLVASTLSYATAMSVPSLRMVMVTSASTGMAKYSGHMASAGSNLDGSYAMHAMKKKNSSCTVHATR